MTVEVDPRARAPAEVQRKGWSRLGAVGEPSEVGHQTDFHPVGEHSLAEANQMREEGRRTPAEGRRMLEEGSRMLEEGLRTMVEGRRSPAEELHMQEEGLRTMEAARRRRPVAAVADRRGTSAQGANS